MIGMTATTYRTPSAIDRRPALTARSAVIRRPGRPPSASAIAIQYSASPPMTSMITKPTSPGRLSKNAWRIDSRLLGS